MKIKRKRKNLFIVFIIIVMAFVWINIIGNRVTDKVLYVLESEIEKEVNEYVFNTFTKKMMVNSDYNKLINISKNKKEEILTIDYNMKEVYSLLSDSLVQLKENISKIDINLNDKNVLVVPLGIGSDNIFISNFGPKIPVKINMLNEVYMGYKTKVSNYGINSILVELYLDITITNKIITIVRENNFNKEYEVLVSSRIITGKIPDYYNGVIEKNSPIINS